MARAMTTGAPWRNVLRFAGPLFVGNVVQQLYSLVDAIVVGRTLGVDALAAVGCTAGLSFFFNGFVWAMGTGAAIPVAQRFGARDPGGMRRAVAAGGIVCAGTGIVLSVVGALVARRALILMNTPAEILDGAHDFLVVLFAAIFVPACVSFSGALMQALGDSKAPTFLWVASSFLNAGLVVLFVRGFGWGISGAAWATVTAQATSFVVGIAYIRWRMPQLIPHRSEFRPTKTELWRHARMGWAMGFQSSVISIGEIAIQRALNSLGPIPVAASTAAVRVSQLAISPLACFGTAQGVYTSQNHGAKEYGRIKLGARETLLMAIGFSVVIGLVLGLFGGLIAGWFLGPEETEAISLAHTYLIVSAFGYPLLATLFVLRYTLQGIGKTAIPTAAGFGELAGRILVATFLVGPLGFVGVALAGPFAWLGSCIPLVAAWRVERRRLTAAEASDAGPLAIESSRPPGDSVGGEPAPCSTASSSGTEPLLE